ncbi:hypothetical protein BD311DRAFT_749684 [Dichomitus squalens]|uniref:Uncharacterized protein n=1 Tax=Dichomitus squalens TaxID=114155 RepID=A0A4Q9MZ03_9APHY|nr:hypothetical protein BD311DRAFT_749684 [Dichomitus squalens]
MSDLAAFDPPPSPPPPSYEISQHEFDQKTSHVLEQSARDPPPRRVDEEGFEVWDEAIFEAALNGMSTLSVGEASRPSHRRASSSSAAPTSTPGSGHGLGYSLEKERIRSPPQEPPAGSGYGYGASLGSGSGSRPYADSASSSSVPSSTRQNVRPLRVQKRIRPQKERPAWYAEAGLGGGSPPPSPLEPQTQAGSSFSRPPPVQLQRGRTVMTSADREGTPPPEFTPVGPSLDGPPYEDAIVMTYEGEPLPPAPGANGTPEPPAFSTPTPPSPLTPASTLPAAEPAHPIRSQTPPAHSHPRPHSAAWQRHPVHSQSMPQNLPASSVSPVPRPHVAAHHQSLPFPSSQHGNVQARPLSFYPPGQPNAPRVPFNPQMAYAKPIAPLIPAQAADTGPQLVDPSAFYSHAVSAHYSFNVPARLTNQTHAGQSMQSRYSQHFTQDIAPSPNGFGSNHIDKGVPPLVSPRPNYGYSQAAFSDTASIYSQNGEATNWAPNGQQGWQSTGGGYQTYR